MKSEANTVGLISIWTPSTMAAILPAPEKQEQRYKLQISVAARPSRRRSLPPTPAAFTGVVREEAEEV